MKFLDELKPLKLYSANRKFYIPINDKNKKKGSAIFLLTESPEASNKLMNLPYMYNPQSFTSYYINRDVSTYVVSDGTIEAEGDELIEEQNSLYFTEENFYKINNSTEIIFDNCTSIDKANIGAGINNKVISNYCKQLGIGQPRKIVVQIVKDKSDFKHFHGKEVLSCNNKEDTISILKKADFIDEMKSNSFLVNKGRTDFDALYNAYMQHELCEILIYSLNKKVNEAIAVGTASYMTGEVDFYKKDSVSSIKMATVIDGIATKYGFRTVRRIIISNDTRFVAMYMGKAMFDTVKGLFKEETFSNVITEAKLSAKERKALPDSSFGIPELRKYPLNDESHVRSAVTMFNHVPEKYEASLAKRIKSRIKDLGINIEIGDNNRFSKYYNSSKSESFLIEENAMRPNPPYFDKPIYKLLHSPVDHKESPDYDGATYIGGAFYNSIDEVIKNFPTGYIGLKQLPEKFTGEYFVHVADPGYIDMRYEGYWWSPDSVNIHPIGKILVNSDYTWKWLEQNDSVVTESCNQMLSAENYQEFITEAKIKFIDDKGNTVPKICPKCGSKVGIFFRGEPVFLCTNKKCGKYFGTVPFKEEAQLIDSSSNDDSLVGLFNEDRTLNILPGFTDKGKIVVHNTDPKAAMEAIKRSLSDKDKDDPSKIPAQLERPDKIDVHGPKELQRWMRSNIHEVAPGKLKSYDEVLSDKSGSTFDQAVVIKQELKRMHFKVRSFFMKEFNTRNPKEIGEAREAVYFYGRDDQVYWIETCMNQFNGVNGPYEDSDDLKKMLFTYHASGAWGNKNRYDNASITAFHNCETGSSLDKIIEVNSSLNEEAYLRASYKMDSMSAEELQQYNENGYYFTDEYARFATPNGVDCITFFGEAVGDKTDDIKLRQALYKERLRNNKMLLDLYAKAQAKNPWIKRTFYTLKRYNGFNIFVDLYYYNSLFLKNNVYKLDKGVNLYWDMLNRLIEDKGINEAYSKKTIFIPVDDNDWSVSMNSDIWDYRKNLNPISLAYRMSRINPGELKSRWGGLTFLFAGSRGYFTIDFNTLDYKNWPRIKNNIRKIVSLDEPIVDDEEPDDFDDEKDSSKVMAANIIGKLEKNTGIEINDLSGIASSSSAPTLDNTKNCDFSTKPFSLPIDNEHYGNVYLYLLTPNKESSIALLGTNFISNKESITGFNRPKK